jgi:hypothetical protein
MWRSILVTAGLIVVALGAIYVMRRYNFLPPASRSRSKAADAGAADAASRPRASLHVVEFEGAPHPDRQSERGVGLIASAPQGEPE